MRTLRRAGKPARIRARADAHPLTTPCHVSTIPLPFPRAAVQIQCLQGRSRGGTGRRASRPALAHRAIARVVSSGCFRVDRAFSRVFSARHRARRARRTRRATRDHFATAVPLSPVTRPLVRRTNPSFSRRVRARDSARDSARARPPRDRAAVPAPRLTSIPSLVAIAGDATDHRRRVQPPEADPQGVQPRRATLPRLPGYPHPLQEHGVHDRAGASFPAAKKKPSSRAGFRDRSRARARRGARPAPRASARHRVRPLVPRTNSKALGHSCLTSIEIVSRSIAPSCRSPRSTRLNPEISGQKNEIFTRGIRFRAFFSSIDRARREKNIHLASDAGD